MKNNSGFKDATFLLDALDTFESYSPFCRAFYRLILEWIEYSTSETVDLYAIFNNFLLSELRHHEALRKANLDTASDLPVWAIIYSQKASALHKTLAALAALEQSSGATAVVRHLLCAECFHQLGRVDLVVASLEAAIREGCDQPLLHFALGYNLYMHAIKSYTSFDAGSGKQVVEDPLNFEQECRRAVAALKRGLTGGPFDPQLYWWIASILENINDVPNARRAYRLAAELDPESYAEAARERLRLLDHFIPEAISEEERHRLAAMGEITVDEILDAFRKVETVADLIARGGVVSSPGSALPDRDRLHH